MKAQVTIQFYAITKANYVAPRTMYWETLKDAYLYFDKAIHEDDNGSCIADVCINGQSLRSKKTNHQIEE